MLFCLIRPANADGGKLCKILAEQLQQVESGKTLSDDDRNTIAAFFSSDPSNMENNSILAFNVFVKRRLVGLPEPVQKEILQILDSTEYRRAAASDGEMHRAFTAWATESDRSLQDAQYDSESQKITIHTTKNYKNLPFTFQIKAHEMEHAIIDQLRRHHNIDEKVLNGLEGAKKDLLTHQEETLAMSSEYLFLNSIPRMVRDQMIQMLKEDGSVDKSQKQWIIENLEWASLSREEYLDRHFKSGRYSLSAIKNDRIAQNVFVYGGLTLAAGGFVFAKLNAKCKEWKSNNPGHASFFNKFCSEPKQPNN